MALPNGLRDGEKRTRDTVDIANDPDAAFGGPEARTQLERKLLRKLDLRMSILVVIYILNHVRLYPGYYPES